MRFGQAIRKHGAIGGQFCGTDVFGNSGLSITGRIGIKKLRGRSTRSSRQKIARASVELLEGRVLLSVENWVGGTGSWNDPTRWSGGAVPTYGDTVNITVPGSVVSGTDSERSDNITTAANTSLNIQAGASLFLDNGGTVSGTLTVAATQGQTAAGEIGAGSNTPLTFDGTTTMDGQFYQGNFTNNGTLGIDDASYFLSGTLTNNGSLNTTGGLNFGSNLDLINSTSGTITPLDDTGLAGNVTNSGVIEMNAGSSLAAIHNPGTIFVNNPSFTFSNQGDVENAGTLDFTVDQGIPEEFEVVNNTGILEKTGGTGTLDLHQLDGLQNTGTILDSSGTLILPQSRNLFNYFTNTIPAGTTFEATNGATITFPAGYGALTEIDGTVILSGPGSNFAPISGVTT